MPCSVDCVSTVRSSNSQPGKGKAAGSLALITPLSTLNTPHCYSSAFSAAATAPSRAAAPPSAMAQRRRQYCRFLRSRGSMLRASFRCLLHPTTQSRGQTSTFFPFTIISQNLQTSFILSAAAFAMMRPWNSRAPADHASSLFSLFSKRYRPCPGCRGQGLNRV